MQLPAHGSNIQYLYESFAIKQPEHVIDFSVNINPLGPPARLKEGWNEWFPLVEDYPDPFAKELVKWLAIKERIPENYIRIGNGAAEIITLIARFLAGKKVLIIHPAFSEYETACKNEGCEVVYHLIDSDWQLDVEEIREQLTDVAALFLCNPNNPSGVAFAQKDVEALIKACEETKTLCIIDEAFYDFLEEPVTFIENVLSSEQVLVIRSLTKMYGIAGLRLGYLAGNPQLIEEIGKTQPHWSVNAIALQAGILCIKEENHVAKTREFITKERQEIFRLLTELGFQYSPSQINFYLLKDPTRTNQQELLIDLMKRGIVLRHTENFPGIEGNWLRVAIKSREENRRLMEALTTWKVEN